jgi:hypothetical protein
VTRPVAERRICSVLFCDLLLGHWDAADGVLTKAVDYDGLGDSEFLACYRAWLDALSGEADAAQAALAGLEEMRANENAQERQSSPWWKVLLPPPRASPVTP